MTPSDLSRQQTSASQMTKHQQRYQRKKMAHSNLLTTIKGNEAKNIKLMKEVSEREFYMQRLQQVLQNHQCGLDPQTGKCSFTNLGTDTSIGHGCSEGHASSTLSSHLSTLKFLNNVPGHTHEAPKIKTIPHDNFSVTDTTITTHCSLFNAAEKHNHCPQHFSTGLREEEMVGFSDWETPMLLRDGPLDDFPDDMLSKMIHPKDQPFECDGGLDSFEYDPSSVDFLNLTMLVGGS